MSCIDMEHFTLMNNDLQKKRMFLFLQGPHGPFFSQLACALESYGHVTSQIGFNKGDKIFWANKRNFIAFTLPIHAWSGFLQRQFRDKRITDLVIYNDTRPFHKTAIQAAHAKGINVHIFEEGYLRPYWITYERDGSNGNSKLMSLAQSAVVPDHLTRGPDPVHAPCHWGICANIFSTVLSIIGAFCAPIVNFPILPRTEKSALGRNFGFI